MAAASTLSSYAAERGVKFFLVTFVDLLGVARSKLVPASAIANVECKGAGFAGYATHFDLSPADPDLFAIPDSTSVIQLPWKREIAWVAADLYMNGEPLQQSPRQVLQAQIEHARSQGLRMKSGVECEFFLLSSGNVSEISDKKDNATKPCYQQDALMRRYDVISEILRCLQAIGWNPYQADHEDANGQFEINWEYDDCQRTADKHVFFKFAVKSIAEKHGLKATFMPKPFIGHTGNGTHCHISIWNVPGTLNIFQDAKGDLGLSKVAYSFIGGILQNAKALTAFLNPTVNSYKRIDGVTTHSGDSWAPCSVSYTGNNRTHMIRIPDNDRIELRLADGAVNPYLLQAAILASGVHGIVNRLQPGPRSDWNGHLPPPDSVKSPEMLPRTFAEALTELSVADNLKKELGNEFIRSYLKIQTELWTSFTRHLSQWEIDNTIDC